MKTLVWFRSDLRLEDNPALKNAFIESDEIHAVFIYSKVQLKRHNESNIKIDFLIRNLNSLEQSLASLNIPLILLKELRGTRSAPRIRYVSWGVQGVWKKTFPIINQLDIL